MCGAGTGMREPECVEPAQRAAGRISGVARWGRHGCEIAGAGRMLSPMALTYGQTKKPAAGRLHGARLDRPAIGDTAATRVERR
jgi:hypothetical protein